jgi:hypothetical protein
MERVLNYYPLSLLNSDMYVMKSPAITTDTFENLQNEHFHYDVLAYI